MLFQGFLKDPETFREVDVDTDAIQKRLSCSPRLRTITWRMITCGATVRLLSFQEELPSWRLELRFIAAKVISSSYRNVSQMFDKPHTLNCLQRLPWGFQQPLIRRESFRVQRVHIFVFVCLCSFSFDLPAPSPICVCACMRALECACVCASVRNRLETADLTFFKNRSCHGFS